MAICLRVNTIGVCVFGANRAARVERHGRAAMLSGVSDGSLVVLGPRFLPSSLPPFSPPPRS